MHERFETLTAEMHPRFETVEGALGDLAGQQLMLARDVEQSRSATAPSSRSSTSE